jgi:hypothetical protein
VNCVHENLQHEGTASEAHRVLGQHLVRVRGLEAPKWQVSSQQLRGRGRGGPRSSVRQALCTSRWTGGIQLASVQSATYG